METLAKNGDERHKAAYFVEKRRAANQRARTLMGDL